MMRSQKIRLKLTKEQERLAWWYSKVSRNFWNLLVDIDKRNNKGEFDEILNKNGNKTYHSKFYDREIYSLNESDYRNLAKIVATKNYDKNKELWSWYYQPNQSFIYASLSRELVKIRKQNYTEDIEIKTDDLPDYTDGIGIDLGIKTLATVSDGTSVPNIKMFRRVRILNKRLKRLQRKVSHKYLINKCNKHNKTKNIIKLERQIKLIHRSLKNIRINHIRKFVSALVKKQPQYIAIEDLNVKGMMKNKHLAKDIANCSFYAIKEHLIRKATERCIAVRLVDRFYPSSKTCSNCGSYKKDLKLNQRAYHCNTCQEKIDRDFNASLNIAKTDRYVLV